MLQLTAAQARMFRGPMVAIIVMDDRLHDHMNLNICSSAKICSQQRKSVVSGGPSGTKFDPAPGPGCCYTCGFSGCDIVDGGQFLPPCSMSTLELITVACETTISSGYPTSSFSVSALGFSPKA